MGLPSLGRGKRVKRRPKQFRDVLPAPPAPLPISISTETTSRERAWGGLTNHSTSCPNLIQRTARNALGILREYLRPPTFSPDHNCTIEDMSDFLARGETFMRDIPALPQSVVSSRMQWYAPLPNATLCRPLDWFWNGSQNKSLADLDALVHNVLQADDYDIHHLQTFSAKREQDRLDKYGDSASSNLNQQRTLMQSSPEALHPKPRLKPSPLGDLGF